MLLALAGLWLLAAGGCGEAEAQEPVEVALADLACQNGDAEGWESATWPPLDAGCTWLRYDGRTTYRVAHDLGRTPRGVHVFLSFAEDGRNAAASAGDTARIVSVTDTHVELRNATNQRFYLKLVLQ